MKTLSDLKREAMKTTEAMGHQMRNFRKINPAIAESTCIFCEKSARVTLGSGVKGNAVEMTCDSYAKRQRTAVWRYQ